MCELHLYFMGLAFPNRFPPSASHLGGRESGHRQSIGDANWRRGRPSAWRVGCRLRVANRLLIRVLRCSPVCPLLDAGRERPVRDVRQLGVNRRQSCEGEPGTALRSLAIHTPTETPLTGETNNVEKPTRVAEVCRYRRNGAPTFCPFVE
jgi:hypothetical protein